MGRESKKKGKPWLIKKIKKGNSLEFSILTDNQGVAFIV